MQYNGSGKLGDEVAKLYGCSPKNNNKISALVGEAKAALGVTTKSKILPDAVKLAIYRWHCDRLNPVQDVKQIDDTQSMPDTVIQGATDGKPETQPDSTVYDVNQNATAHPDGETDSAVYDFEKIHFAVNLENRRTTVMMEGYLVKALQRKHGLVDNPAIRAWIERAIKSDGLRFDPDAPLTRQVKRIITESFV